jgi:hypothetical protein
MVEFKELRKSKLYQMLSLLKNFLNNQSAFINSNDEILI